MKTNYNLKGEENLGSWEKGVLIKVIVSSFKKDFLKITFFRSNQTENQTLIENLPCQKKIETPFSKENIIQIFENPDSTDLKKNLFIFNLTDLFDYPISQKKNCLFLGSIAVSDIFVFNFPWFHFEFENSLGYQKIRKLVSVMKEIKSHQLIFEENPKTFVFFLRDFDLEHLESQNRKEKIEKNLTVEICNGFEKHLTPNLVFFFLPHEFRKPGAFIQASSKFENFLFSQKASLNFPPEAFSKLEEKIETLIERISDFSSKQNFLDNSLDSKEIIGFTVCNEIFLKTLSSFKKSIEPWKICCEEGGIIQNFGEEAERLIEEIISSFEEEMGIFITTKVFLAKKKILQFYLVSQLQKIFEKQIFKLKELSFQSFKEALSSIQVSGDVEHQVTGAIHLTEKYFTNKVESLKPSQAKKIWSSEKERKELVNGIREMATERLQAARLQGVYLKKTKNPISLSLYYLHPHPFGKDLRLDHMTLNDSLGYNPDLTKRAGLMRQFVATRGDSKKVGLDNDKRVNEEDFIYQEEPMKSFQSSSR